MVVISLSKLGENGLFQTLYPSYKVQSLYCYYLEMFKLRKNEEDDLYIYFARRDVRKLTQGTYGKDLPVNIRKLVFGAYLPDFTS